MNIVAISGSLRAASTNTYLLRTAAELAPKEVSVTLFDGLDDLPHCGSRAHAALFYTLGILTAKLPEEASLIIPFVRKKVDADGNITDPVLIQELRGVLTALVNAVDYQQPAT